MKLSGVYLVLYFRLFSAIFGILMAVLIFVLLKVNASEGALREMVFLLSCSSLLGVGIGVICPYMAVRRDWLLAPGYILVLESFSCGFLLLASAFVCMIVLVFQFGPYPYDDSLNSNENMNNFSSIYSALAISFALLVTSIRCIEVFSHSRFSRGRTQSCSEQPNHARPN